MNRLLLALTVATVAVAGCKKDLVCPKGELDCDGKCVALHLDPTNCGACGHACGALETCVDATCRCASDVATCGGACADLTVDPQHCGTCGTACSGATPVCDGSGAGCVASGACRAGETQCGLGCVDLQTHSRNCGACGHACAPGQSCFAGACAADTYVACYWTNEVKPVTRALAYGGPSISLATATPMRLAVSGSTLLAIAGWPLTSVSYVPLAGGAPSKVTLPGYDLEGIAVTGGAAVVTNASVNTLEILSLDGRILDEIPMPDQQSFTNPQGVAIHGTSAYVALNEAQKILRFDLSTLSACLEPDPTPPACNGAACDPDRRCIAGACRRKCGSLANVIDLMQVPGAADGAAHPMPNQVAVAGGKVFVALSNLGFVDTTCDTYHLVGYAQPAGPGRLAMIDPDAADTVSIVSLGAGCKSPSEVVARGSSLWVSCGAFCFPEQAPGALLELDVSTGTPVAGTLIPLNGTVPGQLAFCGTDGYVTDQRKTGAVVRFDPYTGILQGSAAICGANSDGNAWAADIACKQ